jgi:hypothetical protein
VVPEPVEIDGENCALGIEERRIGDDRAGDFIHAQNRFHGGRRRSRKELHKFHVGHTELFTEELTCAPTNDRRRGIDGEVRCPQFHQLMRQLPNMRPQLHIAECR